MGSDPLGSGFGPTLGDPPREMRKAGLPPDLIWDVMRSVLDSLTYMQCGGGAGFKGFVLLLLKAYEIKLLNGQPRHPQTRGLVEKHNCTLKRKLQTWIQNSGCTKLDNGFTELVGYAITHHYPTLEYLATGRTRFVDTHTFDNHLHRVGVPRLERGSNRGEPTPLALASRCGSVVRSSTLGSVRRRRIPQGSTTK